MIRQRCPEMMDQDSVSLEALVPALIALNRSNRWLRVDQRLHRLLKAMAPGRGRCVLDVGAGGGGFLGYLARHHASSEPRLIGLDRSPAGVRQVRAWHGSAINWVRGDGLRLPFGDATVDVVICTLFLHHFDEADAVDILREAARVTAGVLILSDLVRSRPAWLMTWMMTRAFSRSRVFHHDGPVSVRAAYTPDELRALAQAAGLQGARVRRQAPWRMVLTWQRPEAPVGLRTHRP
jgi:SAM-dependent methyltransferase